MRFGIFLNGIRVSSINHLNGIQIGSLIKPVEFSSKEMALGYIQRHLWVHTENDIVGHKLEVKPL